MLRFPGAVQDRHEVITNSLGKEYRYSIANLGVLWELPIKELARRCACPFRAARRSRTMEFVPIREGVESCPLSDS